MNIREPNGTVVENLCDDCTQRAVHVIAMKCVTVSLCPDHFTELAIALSLAVTEEHPDA